MAYCSCHGADLYDEDLGAGRPIVFLPGVLHSLRFFGPQFDAFAGTDRPIGIDYRGHGRSEKTDLGHTVAQYARDLEAFISQLDLEDIVLVGWSLGAFVSWDYVRQFGTDRLCGLVDIDIEATRFKWDDYEYGLTDIEGLRETMGLVQSDRTRLIDRFAEQLFAQKRPTLTALQFDELSRVPAPIMSAIVFDGLTRDYRAVLPGIDVPMLVCAGAFETRGPGTVDSVSHVADLVPEATFELFEESGYCPHLEEPERFNRVLRRFVESL